MSKTYEQLEPVISALDKRIKTNLEAYPTDTAVGSIASFPDGADGIPLKSCIVQIEPAQDLSHGDPSPDNICPISGWDEVNVTRTGVNVWDEELEIGRINQDTGQNTSLPIVTRSKNYIRIPQGEQIYTILPWAELFWYRADKSFIKHTGTGNPEDGAVYGKLITPPSGACFLRFRCSGSYGKTYKHDITINYPATDTEYHAYNGTEIPISWESEAGTIYGGSLDVLNGVLTVDKGFIVSYNGEALPGSWISDRDVYAEGATPTTGAEVCYTLAEPITYQLTPHEVKSLLGSNTIYADTGNTAVEYRADTTTYINRKIAEAISALS